MPVRRYAVCDECESEMVEYDTLKNRENTGFKYGEIVDTGEPQFATVERWTVKAKQCESDPIAVEYEFYCPDCSAIDGMFDSGDTR